ncbi:unnamed protein product [Caenorhabditis sp. 36 PRJEB53466]|nr:unnamed protein product [Caenorhabditis sp. 36 PRJEB53466]
MPCRLGMGKFATDSGEEPSPIGQHGYRYGDVYDWCTFQCMSADRLFRLLKCPFPSKSAFMKAESQYVFPVVDEIYDEIQKKVTDIVFEEGEKNGGINIASDAMYDSRGHSADYCRTAVLDLKNNFVLEQEVCRKSRTDLYTVSPYFATSQTESFNSITCLYNPKDHFFPQNSFETRAKLAGIHWNCGKLEIREGKRPIVGFKTIWCKSKKEEVKRKTRKQPSNDWRTEIMRRVRGVSLVEWNNQNIETEEAADLSDEGEESDEELTVT